MNETYLMEYDNEGNILGFYPKSLLAIYKDIPEKSIEITAEKHQFYMENQGKYKLNILTLEDELLIFEPVPQSKGEVELLKEKVELMQKALDEILLGGAF